MNNAKARAQLAYGYALPIAGAAIGTVVGLMLNDLLPNEYDNWTWVVVQAILGTALILGTRSSTVVRNFELRAKKNLNAQGARIMNFVLSVIWSTVMAFMSIGFITSAVDNLKKVEWIEDADKMNGHEYVTFLPFTIDVFVRDFLPAILILGFFVFGTLLWLVNRAKEE